MRRLMCIVNPAAGGGRRGKVWQEMQATLSRLDIPFEFRMTRASGDATGLAREALASGYLDIAAVGGDGTVHEVVNGFFRDGQAINKDAALLVVPCGTGTDFARTLGLQTDARWLAQLLHSGQRSWFDVGTLNCNGMDGAPHQRYFVNIADFGNGGALLERKAQLPSAFGGFLSYLGGLIINTLTYRSKSIRFRVDDGEPVEGLFNAVIAANARYFGGGMHVAPMAQPDDGQLEFVSIGNIGILEILYNLPRLYRGTILNSRHARHQRGTRLRAESAERVLIDADGELAGQLPAEFGVIPSAFQVYRPLATEKS